MKLSQLPTSSVILSGAKDPIPVYGTTISARSFYHSLTRTFRVPAVRRSSDVGGLTQ